MKKLLFLVFFLGIGIMSYAQIGGARAYVGPTVLVNNNKTASPEGTSHTGYHVGIDGRLMAGGMSFLVGGRYVSLSRNSIEKFKMFGHDDKLTMMQGRVGLDFSIFSFAPNLRIRSKLLIIFDVVLNTTGESNLPKEFTINDGWLTLGTGIGADLGPVVIDIDYGYGFLNGYYQQESSSFQTYSASIGFFF